MNDKLDVFEILSQKNTETQKRGQEQQHVPDPDFNDAIKLLDINYSTQETEKKAEPDPEPKKEPVPMKKKKPAKSRVSVKRVLKKHVLVLLLAVAVLLLLFTFVLNISAVAGPSMEPALEDGDRVVINRLARNFDAGDIIVFETGGGERLVKRIVADNGDVVSITADKGLDICIPAAQSKTNALGFSSSSKSFNALINLPSGEFISSYTLLNVSSEKLLSVESTPQNNTAPSSSNPNSLPALLKSA